MRRPKLEGALSPLQMINEFISWPADCFISMERIELLLEGWDKVCYGESDKWLKPQAFSTFTDSNGKRFYVHLVVDYHLGPDPKFIVKLDTAGSLRIGHFPMESTFVNETIANKESLREGLYKIKKRITEVVEASQASD